MTPVMRLGMSALSTFMAACWLLGSGGCSKEEKETAPIVQTPVYNRGPLNYLAFVPGVATAARNGKYPMILSLHGIGERGNDLGTLKRDGLPKVLDGYNSFPFIVISPQCPSSTEWYYDRTDTLVDRLLEIVIREYPVDTARIYVTGYSMGGIGAWDVAIRYPGRFAAAVPIAARREAGWDPAPMKDIPVWAFHGAKDDVVPLSRGQDIVDAFKGAGGTVTFTVYADLYHDSWSRTYARSDVFAWMLEQQRH